VRLQYILLSGFIRNIHKISKNNVRLALLDPVWISCFLMSRLAIIVAIGLQKPYAKWCFFTCCGVSVTVTSTVCIKMPGTHFCIKHGFQKKKVINHGICTPNPSLHLEHYPVCRGRQRSIFASALYSFWWRIPQKAISIFVTADSRTNEREDHQEAWNLLVKEY
jgi:hypothetical protein